MDFLLEALTNWLKEMLVGGIMSNLSGMFDSVNQQVADISVQVGQTPQGWNGSIFNMIENLSNSIMVPIAGVILAIGRVIGETAALIYTAGTVAEVPKNLMGSGRTLALHMYVLSGEGLHMNQASATAVVILAFVLVINFLSGAVAKRIAKG